jgi:hypothetical protein
VRLGCALVACGAAGCANVLGIGDWTNLRDDVGDAAPSIADATTTDVANDADAQLDAAQGAADASMRDALAGGDATVDAGSTDASPDARSTDASPDAGPSDATFDADGPLPDVAVGDEADAAGEAEAGPPGGTLAWTERAGITGYTTPTSIALDPSSGDVVVVGYFVGTVDFGGGVLSNHGDAAAAHDAFVARFDSAGRFRWAKGFGGGLLTIANGVAVDSSGNVAVGGLFQGGVDFGVGAVGAVGDLDLFLLELDSAGNYRWCKTFGASGQAQGLDGVAADGQGAVFLAGQTSGADLGGGPMTGYTIAGFKSGGAYAWSHAFALTTQGAQSLAANSAGDLVLAGAFTGSVDFGSGALTSAGNLDAFVARFNASGGAVWSKRFGDPSDQSITGVALDPNANVYITGPYGGGIDFGAGTLDAGAGANAFMAALDPDGGARWSDGFIAHPDLQSDPFNLNFLSVAVDGSGEPTLACIFLGSVDFGEGPLTSDGEFHSFAVAHFDASGAPRWAYAAGAPSTALQSTTASLTSVAATQARVVVTGSFGTCTTTCAQSPPETTLVLDGTTLTAVSAEDIFLASFVP